jgi:glycosyltransferase involved in cell wall biosynthesis
MEPRMKISIITPSFNQGPFIERTLASVANQTLPEGIELEHCIMDGGSTDNTVSVLKTFPAPIQWVSETDKGQTHAVNKGILATNGEIIGWLNSDDIYYPNALTSVIRFFEKHPHVDVVYGMADHIDLQDHAFEAYPTEPWDFKRLQETCFICQPALFFRRNIIRQYGLLDESLNYCMDYEYWLRLGKADIHFAYLPEKLAGSRLYADNKTLGARPKVHQEINDMFKKLFDTVPDRWLFNYAHAMVEQQISRTSSPTQFKIQTGLKSLFSAIKWNKRISGDMFKTIFSWL